jgi:hypothetical protein
MRASETNGHDDSFLMFALIMILNIRKSTVYFRPLVGRPRFIRFAKANKTKKMIMGKIARLGFRLTLSGQKATPFQHSGSLQMAEIYPT